MLPRNVVGTLETCMSVKVEEMLGNFISEIDWEPRNVTYY